MRFSIIIPAHNEEKRIGETLDHYLNFFLKDTVFIVVVNGSTDQTSAVARERKQRFNHLKIIEIKEAIGKGGAVEEGFKHADGDLIGYVDADEATSPEEFDRLKNAIGEYDGVIASRSIKGARAQRTFIRRFIAFGFHVIVRMLFGLPYHDTQCGAKIFKKEAVKRILPDLTVKDMAFDVDLLYQLKKAGFRIKEEPTAWQEKGDSAFLGSPGKLFKNSFNIFISLLKLRFK